MKLTFRSQSYFPFAVPEKDSTFASSVGPQTVYPAGFSLERALQIYWRAQTYQLIAAANGALGHVTQALATSGPLPVRNAVVGTNTFYEVDGLSLSGPGDLVTGVGLRQIIPGGGTITSTGTGTTGTNPDAAFNLQVNLFWPEIFAADPVVKYAGQWWPALSVSCATTNSVTLDSGGESDISFTCDTYDPSSTTEIGAFTFFGVSVPVFCADLASGETRTFSGSIAVTDEWA
jgi:hypothetical protein